ncbi:MAG: peptidoglycan editing factor PgeF [Elusimicrobiota bacterium]
MPLEKDGFINAFSTRFSGVSPFPENSLNLAFIEDDTQENVIENRRRFLKAIDKEPAHLYCNKQVHSDIINKVDCSSISSEENLGDALFSNLKNIILGVKTADCQSILIGDRKSGLFCSIHAGWQGTLQEITLKAVHQLVSLGASTDDMIAALGPSACGQCYEVGSDVKNKFESKIADNHLFIRIKSDGRYFLDVPKANMLQLLKVGIKPSQIFQSGFCTIHENNLFFSHRLEGLHPTRPKGKTGRHLSIIGKF